MVTAEEIEAAKTPSGGWTRKQLSEWGVGWPPKKGWKYRLIGEQSEPRPLQYAEKPMNKPAWNYVKDQAEIDRLEMKKLYQEKSGDYRY